MIARLLFQLKKLWRLLKGVFPPRTAWNRIVWLAWLAFLGYLIFLVCVMLGRWRAPNPALQGLLNAVFAVALMILSIRYSGVVTDFYQKLTGFGITDIRVNRHGHDPNFNQLWMDRVSGGRAISIVGTSSRGWFRLAGGSLEGLLAEQRQVRINVYLLDPFGSIWRGLIGSNTVEHVRFMDDAIEVFRTLRELAAAHKDQFVVHLYDTEPMSFVWAKGTIYLGLYLPRTSRKEVPEFTISEGSFLGQKVIESATKLMKTAPSVTADIIGEYRQIMQEHAVGTREQFWRDPFVYCDFCKELRGFPCTFSRRHSGLSGDRVVRSSQHSNLLPSLGALLPGHALLVPTEHVTSLARLQGETFTDCVSTADAWAKKIGSGKVSLTFEHGTPSDDVLHGGCGICHCHLHLLPMPSGSCDRLYERLALFLEERGYKPNFKELKAWDELHAYEGSAYIAIRLGSDSLRVMPFPNDVPVQSQLLRQFVATGLLHSTRAWDWRDSEGIDLDGEKDELIATINELKRVSS